MEIQTQAQSLLSKLESYDYAGIDTLYISFLHPFSPFISPNPNPKPPQKPTIRSLAKTYLPFINKSLSLFARKLFETPKHVKTVEYVSLLLEGYRVCLECLAVLSAELSGKKYGVWLQKGRYVHCLVRWERFHDGFDEGVRVLTGLGRVDLDGEGFGFTVEMMDGRFVPRLLEGGGGGGGGEKGNGDRDEFVRLVVDLVVVVSQCVSVGRSKDAGKYSGMLVLLREVHPWLRHMEASASSKLQWKLLAQIKNATSFLIREVKHFGEDLVCAFCAATFNEYTQLLNARCHQGRMREELEEFVQFLSSFSYKCRSACKKVQSAVSMHLYKSASKFSQGLVYIGLVQKLYAVGLNVSEFGAAKDSVSASCFGFLPEGWDKLQDLSSILESGKSYYDSNSEVDLSFYLNALKFLCGPLAQYINSERKRMVKDDIAPSHVNVLKLIQQAFVEYCSLFPLCHKGQGGREEIDMVVLSISMASFTLSLKLFRNTKGGKILVNHLLSEKYIMFLQPQMLNYLVCMLHNLFVEFYRHELFEEAVKVGKFCCRVSWSRCILFGERAVSKSKGSEEETSESMITEFVKEACKDNSLLMDILLQIDCKKVDDVILSGLEKWCHARNLFQALLCPQSLIKRWVKVQCKLYGDTDANAPILGSRLLSSSYIQNQKVSTETIGIILEQELLLYQDLSSFNPEFCQRMQMAIIEILLLKVHLSNRCLQRYIVLTKKALLLRNPEIGGLESCIDCLSKAIKSIDGLSGMTQDEATSMYSQLATLYCLRALTTQEANPSSKGIVSDIRKAVTIWLRYDAPYHYPRSENDVGCVYLLQLLYHIADLLSIKGNTALHIDILNVVLKALKQMNVSLDKCLALLWESRRVNHALCAIPVNEAFIVALSNVYGREAESFEFWVNCVKDHQILSVGLKQNFSFLSSFFPLSFNQHKRVLQSGISLHEAKQVALDLISKVSLSSSSAFLAGHICFDLSERLSASGKLIEALLYAKEAHGVRSKMLQDHFSFKYEQHEVTHDEATQKSSNCVRQFTVISQVAIRAWPNHANSLEKSDGFLLTPWSVLHSFLESCLQVGILHETLGNVAEAEALFLVGKSISSLQSLPMFTIAFSTCLGKVYNGKCLLDLANKELGTAQQVLAAERDPDTCSKCFLMLESSLNVQLGKLCRKGILSTAVNPYESSLRSLISLEEGDLTLWFEEKSVRQPVHGSEPSADTDTGNDRPTSPIKNRRTKIRAVAKKSTKPKKELESQVSAKPCVPERNSRVTRSSKQSAQNDGSGCGEGVHNTNRYSDCQIESEVTSVSNKVDCEKCLLGKLKGSGSLTSLIRMKWEYFRRRQILKLLIGLGKCQGTSLITVPPHKIYSKCISILHGGNDCHCSSSSSFELEFIGEEIHGDSLAHECAEVFYTFGWYIAKVLYSSEIRTVNDVLSSIRISHIVSLLKHAHVLSREIPLLFQKVSKLLVLIYLVSVSRENMSFPLSSRDVHPENYWAAYFHQAAVGTHYNLRLLSAIIEKYNSQTFSEVQDSQGPPETDMTTEMRTLLSIIPESTKEIEKCMANFFESLPDSAVVCISFLEKSYVSLLDGLMHYPSCVYGLMLLSYMTADSQPVVILLPLSSLVEEAETIFSCPIVGERNACKEWRSPWGSNALVDNVAPLFRSVLRENYLSCSSFPEDDTEKNRQMWWTQRFSLDDCLQNLIREMEESWFGQWRYLLLGRWLNAESLIPAMKELMQEIQERFKLGVNQSVLEAVMGGTKSTNLEKERIPKVFLEKGCYISSVKDCDVERFSALDQASEGDSIPGSVFTDVNKHELEYCTRREPVILVLDSNIQMLPWESMPIMREQEIYRVPSVASILVALERRSNLEKAARLTARFPLIDPLDAFYLLNPSGDLSCTQSEFEDWFRSQNIQGIAGVVPSITDWTAALESHDLFLYFGHGSGAQYMPPEKIKKLENCAATLLMGCCSGTLNLKGSYPPVGTPLSYILAGSPIVIANLWEVTDRDIDRFAKAMLKSFMEERSMSSSGCIQCSLLAEEFESMTVNENRLNPKRARGKKKPTTSKPDVGGGYCFKHKLRAGYFVSQARKACKLPYLIGAAPVCYGVPTGIKKKREIS